jgi:TrmH family RNA methyltransferase
MLVKSVIKDIQSLALKKYRDQTGHYLAEGPKLVAELLQFHRDLIVSLYALPEWIDMHQKSLEGITVVGIDEKDLARISQLQTPHQVVAVLRQPQQMVPTALGQFTIACCGLQDPGNLGTIIRTADWFGVRQLVCSPDTVDCFNPKVVQASMGSVFRVKLYYTALEQWIDLSGSIPVLAATMQGTDVRSMHPLSEAVLLIGNESAGIPASLLQRATHVVSITGKGSVESLNAAVATGIILSYLR